MNEFLSIKPEVEQALRAGKPVVALESTILSHGMPYPENIAMAQKVEGIIRDAGAVPATIAIIDGKLKAGLDEAETERLARGKDVIKASRRDIPFAVSRKLTGASTVATTMIIAHMAGIRVFVTGGIGGVHRGASETFDISADLQELARTPVAVVCAGAKAILDIGLTLEYLETYGVPVVGYGTDDFPAFYTRKSGFGVDYRADSPDELAAAIKAKWDMGLGGGVLVGNPIPEEFSMDEKVITAAIDSALADAREQNIRGKETTPFLLAAIKELTGGESLASNMELVYNNARVGAQLATSLSNLYR